MFEGAWRVMRQKELMIRVSAAGSITPRYLGVLAPSRRPCSFKSTRPAHKTEL